MVKNYFNIQKFLIDVNGQRLFGKKGEKGYQEMSNGDKGCKRCKMESEDAEGCKRMLKNMYYRVSWCEVTNDRRNEISYSLKLILKWWDLWIFENTRLTSQSQIVPKIWICLWKSGNCLWMIATCKDKCMCQAKEGKKGSQ